MNLKEELGEYLAKKGALHKESHIAYMEMIKGELPKDICMFCGKEDGWEDEVQASYSVFYWRDLGPVCTRGGCEKKAKRQQGEFHYTKKAPFLVKKG